MQLSGSADNTERGCIVATQRIVDRVIFGVCRLEGLADVCAGGCILCDGARRAATVSKGGCLIDVSDIDRDGDSICQTAIGSRNSNRIGTLRFIVQGCVCLELSGCSDDTKRCRIVATEGVRQRIPTVCIGGNNSCADILSGSRVFRNSARRAIAVSEHRCAVLRYIRDADYHINRRTPTLAIRGSNSNGIGALCFIIQCCVCLELPGRADNTKCCCVRATETIGQRIRSVYIGSCKSRADVCTGGCILWDGARRADVIGETWCFVDVGDIDSDKDRVEVPLAIRCTDGEIVVNVLGFKI